MDSGGLCFLRELAVRTSFHTESKLPQSWALNGKPTALFGARLKKKKKTPQTSRLTLKGKLALFIGRWHVRPRAV